MKKQRKKETNKTRLLNTENKWVVVRGEVGWWGEKQVKGIKSAYSLTSSEYRIVQLLYCISETNIKLCQLLIQKTYVGIKISILLLSSTGSKDTAPDTEN